MWIHLINSIRYHYANPTILSNNLRDTTYCLNNAVSAFNINANSNINSVANIFTWQDSTAVTSWTNVGTNINSFIPSNNIGGTKYYRVIINNTKCVISSNIVKVIFK